MTPPTRANRALTCYCATLAFTLLLLVCYTWCAHSCELMFKCVKFVHAVFSFSPEGQCIITGCCNPANDASSNAEKARCLLVDHGGATWGYEVVSPSWEGRDLDILIQQQRDWHTRRQSVTRSCTKACLLTSQSQFPSMSRHWVR